MNRLHYCRLAFCLACWFSCTTPPRDVVQAGNTYRAFKRIAAATSVGVAKVRYDELTQDATTELLIFSDFARDQSDSLAIHHYSAALQKYRDAGVLWGEEINNAPYSFAQGPGEISLETTPAYEIAVRYNFPITINKTYPPASRRISSSSIQALWQLAVADEAGADSVVLKRLR